MYLPNITSGEQLTESQLAYLSGLANDLSKQSDDHIKKFAERAASSPDVQQILASPEMAGDLQTSEEQMLPEGIFSDMQLSDASFTEESIFTDTWPKVKLIFTNVKRKTHRIFCEVATGLANDKDLNLKKILKDVLLVLIPAFAGATGIMPVVLPIVISLAALLIKYGVAQVCPV